MIKSELVHCVEQLKNGPVTHAIVFGVGTYPHGRDISEVASLDNLTSPIASARAMTDWLITSYDNPERPLASVALIVSADAPFVYRNPVTGDEYEVPTGTTADFERFVSAWAQRAGTSFDNGSFFYYCGHGLSSGMRDCLLSRSFGQDPYRHLSGVFERASLVNTMRFVGPKHQFYLFDTCRNESKALLDGGVGLPALLYPRPGTGARGEAFQCRLLATAEGRAAFGQDDQPSLFLSTFFAACKSAGTKTKSEWWITSTKLLEYMNRFMVKQRPQLEGPAMEICRMGAEPMVPVAVCCDPEEHIYQVRLEMRSAFGEQHAFDGSRRLSAEPWKIELLFGSYSVAATACSDGNFDPIEGTQVMVYPPFTDITIDIVRGTVS